MKRVRFLLAFDFSPVSLQGRVTVAYKAGWEGAVTEACATKALADGAAEIVEDVAARATTEPSTRRKRKTGARHVS